MFWSQFKLSASYLYNLTWSLASQVANALWELLNPPALGGGGWKSQVLWGELKTPNVNHLSSHTVMEAASGNGKTWAGKQTDLSSHWTNWALSLPVWPGATCSLQPSVFLPVKWGHWNLPHRIVVKFTQENADVLCWRHSVIWEKENIQILWCKWGSCQQGRAQHAV